MSEQKHFYSLIDLVNTLKGVDWDFEYLSWNKNITMQDIENNKNDDSLKPFLKYSISSNPNLTVEFVLKYPDDDKKDDDIDPKYKWNWQSLTYNLGFPAIKKYPSLPWTLYHFKASTINDWEYVMNEPKFHKNKHLIKYMPLEYIPDFIELQKKKLNNEDFKNLLSNLAENPNINIQFIKEHPEIEWNYNLLSTFLPISEIQKDPSSPWNYKSISSNETLTAKFVIQHPNEDWSEYLSNNINVDFEKIQKAGLDNLIDFRLISFFANPKITIDFILNNLNRLDLSGFHKNGIIKMQDILDHPELVKNYAELSTNPNLEIWYVLANKEEKWDIAELSGNKAFKVQDIKEAMDNLFDWSFKYLSYNPNLTFDFIYRYRHKGWDWGVLSDNLYDEEQKVLFVTNKLKKKYTTRKNNKVTKILNKALANVLTKIIFEY